MKAPLFVPENHFFDIGGKLTCDAVIGRGAEYRVPPRLRKKISLLAPERFRDVLRAEVLEENHGEDELPELDFDAFQRRVLEGKPVLVTPRAKRGRA